MPEGAVILSEPTAGSSVEDGAGAAVLGAEWIFL